MAEMDDRERRSRGQLRLAITSKNVLLSEEEMAIEMIVELEMQSMAMTVVNLPTGVSYSAVRDPGTFLVKSGGEDGNVVIAGNVTDTKTKTKTETERNDDSDDSDDTSNCTSDEQP